MCAFEQACDEVRMTMASPNKHRLTVNCRLHVAERRSWLAPLMLLLVDPQVEQKLDAQLALQSCIADLLEADSGSHIRATTVCLYSTHSRTFRLMLIGTPDRKRWTTHSRTHIESNLDSASDRISSLIHGRLPWI